MGFANRSNRAALHEFDDATIILARMDLSAHLRRQILLGRQFGQYASFVDRVRQRFLTIGVLAHSQGHGSGRRMGMIRSGDHDGVDSVTFLFQHHSKVSIPARSFVLPAGCIEKIRIDVCQRDNVLTGTTADVLRRPIRRSQSRNVEFFERRV